jgi:phage terminase large subunit
VIIFQGMQDHNAESIKSLENFKRAWIEEAQTLSTTLAVAAAAYHPIARLRDMGKLESAAQV